MEGNRLSTCSWCFCYHFSYRTSPPGPAAYSIAVFLSLVHLCWWFLLPVPVPQLSRQKTFDCLQASEGFSRSIHLGITHTQIGALTGVGI